MVSSHSSTDRSRETAQRIVCAAAVVFAEKGFDGSTTREIADRADVNIASLHYHFGDKRALYLAVFERFTELVWADHPLPTLMASGLCPGEKLHGLIEAALERILDAGRMGDLWRLILRELMDPSEALDRVLERISRPMFNALSQIVRSILGPGADDQTVRLSAASIIGQCFFYRFAGPLVDRVIANETFDRSPKTLARHIATFSLGALHATRRRLNREKVQKCKIAGQEALP